MDRFERIFFAIGTLLIAVSVFAAIMAQAKRNVERMEELQSNTEDDFVEPL